MYRAGKVWRWSVVVGLWFASAQGAWADEEKNSAANDSGEAEQARPNGEVGVELGGYFRSDNMASRLALSPLVSGWVSVADGVDLKLDWGLAFVSLAPNSGSSQTGFYLGNPTLSARRVIRAYSNEVFFGIGVAVPVSSISDRPRSLDDESKPIPDDWDNSFLKTRYASRIAAAMRGLWDYWIWMPEHLGIVVPVGVRMVSETHILAAGETAIAVLVPTGDYETDRAELILQFAGELGFGFEWLSAGFRVQAVMLPVPGGDEAGHAQFSVGPFARLESKGAFFYIKGLFNLDTPYGAFDEGPDVWGATLGGGVKF
jgi:hypothetical protein